MINHLNGTQCTGCMACVQKCPQNCIEIKFDPEGFQIPVIIAEKCIDCHLCERTCPQLNPVELKQCTHAYAARVKDTSILKQSTSGGVFAAAALEILGSGGIVFGVEMTSEGKVQSTWIQSRDELFKLQGSKYVQAEVGNTYVKAKEFLNAGREVLFSGTPCQIAGLRKYLSRDYDNLYTIDLICHGVPSQELFRAYWKWMEKKHRQKLHRWSFRDKNVDGWELADQLSFENKTVSQREMLDHYTLAFLKGSIYRESCYECRYAQGDRTGDLTLGDYWGIKKIHPDFFSPNGVSAVLVNSVQGEKLMSRIGPKLELIESSLEWMQQENGNLKAPSARPKERDTIYVNLHQKSFDEFLNTDLKVPFSPKERIKQFIPHEARQKIKKFLFRR